MGLFSIFGKKKEVIIPGQQLNRLDADGEIPYGWHYANRETIGRLEAEHRYFSNAYCTAKNEGKGVLAEYSALKSLVQHMEDSRNLCASMGECFAKWASHSVADPSDLTELKAELARLKDNMDALLKREKAIKLLKEDLLAIIRAEPGIVQSDIYKRFNPEFKSDIQNQLHSLWASNIIIREKSGRSYKLFVK